MCSCVVLRCITPWTSASKINKRLIQLRAPSSGETRELIRRVTLTVHYGDSVAVECTSVVHLLLRCIVGLNECTREHPLWFRTPLKMAVPLSSALFEGIRGDFGYSHAYEKCIRDRTSRVYESFLKLQTKTRVMCKAP